MSSTTRIADVYHAVSAKAGPLIARPVSITVAALEGDDIDERTARDRLTDALTTNPLTRTDDSAEVRARLADPDTRRFIDWHTRGRSFTVAQEVEALVTDRAFAAIWKGATK